jgi:VWFA-related protein
MSRLQEVRVKTAFAAAVLAVLASPLFAQQSEVIDVQVTNLDVVVSDAKGNRVTGLTAADFEVLEDGQKRAVTNLAEVSRTTTSTESMQPAPRRILLIVDNATIALSARRKVFDATRATLDQLLIRPSDRISIATISRSLTQRLGWTGDRAQVEKVLAEVEKDAILPRADLLELERALEMLARDADAAAGSMGGGQPGTGIPGDSPNPGSGNSNLGGGGRTLPPVEFQQVLTRGRNFAQNAANETKQTLSALNAALTAFAAVPGGRKLVILVGGGLPLNAGDAIFRRIESVRQQAELSGHKGFANARGANPLTATASFDVTQQVDAVAATAKLKGVAIYAVNPEFGDRQTGGAGSSFSADNSAEFAAQASMLDGYQRLAAATGGTAMIGRPAESALTEIRNDLESYYSLGYRSDAPLTPKSRIEVKVRKGLRARAVIASGAISRDWEVSDQVLANHLLEPSNPLGISLAMDPPVAAGEKRTIPMKILIPVNSLKLVKDGSEYAASFAVFVSIGDKGGNGSDPNRQEQSFRWSEAQVAQVKGKTIGFAVNVEADPDRDRVSVGVLDRLSGEATFARVMLP